MPLYDPDGIPHALEVNSRIAKIENFLGIDVTPEMRTAIAGMTRAQIAEYIEGLITA